jgi:hypothetical protein
MQQTDISRFRVKQGEEITVEVEAVLMANFDSFTVDGEDVPPASNAPRTYRFTATQQPDFPHRTTLTFVFPEDADDNALYRVFVSGDQGGGRFDGPVVGKEDGGSDGVIDCDLTFRVTE